MLYPGLRLKNDRYEVLSLLRRGGAGVVWRGLDRIQGRQVALKALVLDGGGLAAMEREAEAALRARHPAVLAPLDTFVDAEHAWIVLDLCVGSVADALDEHGPLPAQQALALLADPIAALAAAHAAGVVHRDVKPSNLLLAEDGGVFLADFGIARMLADTRALTRSTALMGSLPYMAPEQRRDPRDVCPATDVYAVAATLAAVLLGQPAGDLFAAGAEARLKDVGVPPALCSVILRAGAYDPGERPADAAALWSALREAVPEADARNGAALSWLPSGRDWRSADADGVAPTRAPPTPAAVPLATDAPPTGRTPSAGMLAGIGAVGAVATIAALLAGVAIGLRDDVRARVIDDPPLVASARAFASLPVCDTATTWSHSSAPQREAHPDGLREATPTPLLQDLDGDGRIDAAYVHNASDAVRIFWGTASGAIDAEGPQDFPSARGRGSVVRADLDGNSLDDIVWSHADGIWWLPHTGPRTFGEARHIEEVERVEWLAAGDVDRDGHDDLLLTVTGVLFLRRGAGDGTLGTLSQLGIRARESLLADVVGDGGVDLVTVEAGALRVREGLAGGGLAPPVDIGPQPLQTVLSLSAWRSGGVPSIAILGAVDSADYYANAARGVQYAPGPDGAWRGCALRDTFTAAGTAGDVNGDGKPDVAAASSCGYCTSEYHIWTGR